MAPLTYSWIALTAATPVVMVLITWALAVFHCRKNEWRSMDVFLVAILSQSVIQQFLGFVFALLSLLKVGSLTGDALCTGMLWFFTCIPIFKGLTVVSLGLDRFFNLKWPYRYRLSVRRNQVRYHVGVLAILSTVVGFATVLTGGNGSTNIGNGSSSWGNGNFEFHHHVLQEPQRNNRTSYSFDQCSFIPYGLDVKFILFYMTLHSLLILLGLATLLVLKFYLCCRKYPVMNRSTSDLNVLAPTLSNTSTASSSVSSENQRKNNTNFQHPPATVNPLAAIHLPAVHGHGSPFSELTNGFTPPGLSAKAVLNMPQFKPPKKRARNPPQILSSLSQAQPDLRVSTAAAILGLTILTTHVPLLGGTIVGFYFPGWIQWPLSNVVLWAQVLEGLALPLILAIVDSVVPKWIFSSKSLGKKGSSFLEREHRRQEVLMRNSFPPSNHLQGHQRNSQARLNNVPNTTAELIQNLRRGHMAEPQEGRSGQNGKGSKGANIFVGHKFPITNGSLFASLTAAGNGLPGAHTPNRDEKAKESREDGKKEFCHLQDSLYTSFNNDDFDSFASFNQDSYSGDLESLDRRCASVTTVANDDFEFHHPNQLNKLNQPDGTLQPNHSQQIYRKGKRGFDDSTFTIPSPNGIQELIGSLRPSYHQNRDQKRNHEQEKCHPYFRHYPMDKENMVKKSHTDDEFEEETVGGPASLNLSQKLTSLSMNDLDLLEDQQPRCLSSKANLQKGKEHSVQSLYDEGEVQGKGPSFVAMLQNSNWSAKGGPQSSSNLHCRHRSSFDQTRTRGSNLNSANSSSNHNSNNTNSSCESQKGKRKYKKADHQQIYISHVPVESRRLYRKRLHPSANMRRGGMMLNPPHHLNIRDRKVLSLESLSNALAESNISYLDTGDLLRHPSERKMIFVTDFI